MNPKSEFLRSLNIIFLALLFGQLLFLVVTVFVSNNPTYNPINDPELEQIMQFLLILFVLTNIPLAYFIFGRKIKAIDKEADMLHKFDKYKQAFIIKMALLEMVSMFGIVVYLLFVDRFLLLIPVLIIVVFMINKPLKHKIENDLHLQ